MLRRGLHASIDHIPAKNLCCPSNKFLENELIIAKWNSESDLKHGLQNEYLRLVLADCM